MIEAQLPFHKVEEVLVEKYGCAVDDVTYFFGGSDEQCTESALLVAVRCDELRCEEKAKLERVDEIKRATGCPFVFVDNRYKNVFIPIFNDAQKAFVLEVVEGDEFSYFAEMLTQLFETKIDNIDDLRQLYGDMIDDLD